MKKFFCILLAIVMMVSFTACGKETPEKAADNALKAVKNLNPVGIAKYFGDDMVEDIDIDEISADDIEVVKKFLNKTSWEILGSVEDESTATVTVRLTTVDLVPIVKKIAGELMGDAFSSIFGGEIDEEEMQKKAVKLFDEMLSEKEVAMATNDVELDMTLTEKGWKIELNESFFGSVLGDLDLF